MAMMETYRRGAGRRSRQAASTLLVLMLVWFCYAITHYGNTRMDRLVGLEQHPFFGRSLMSAGGAITEWVTPSLLISLAVFAVGLFWLRAYLNRPRVADLLISTEAELKKVRWAPRKEVGRASGVVMYYVVWFAVIIFVMDLTFSFGVGLLQRQDWKAVGWGRVVTMVFRLEPPGKQGGKSAPGENR